MRERERGKERERREESEEGRRERVGVVVRRG